MANFTEFTRLISNFAPNVPPFVVSRAAQEVCQDLFSRTGEYKDTIQINTIAGQRKYVLVPNVLDSFIQSITSVSYDLVDKLTAIDSPTVVNAKGKPKYYFVQTHTEILFDPIPDNVFTIDIEVSLCPNINATSIPDELYFKNTQALRYGMLAVLKFQTGTEWYNPSEAQRYQQLYETEVNQRKLAHSSLFTSQNTFVQSPKFA